MKKILHRVAGLAGVILLLNASGIKAQTVLFTTDFDSKDTANVPALSQGWSTNYTDSGWVLSNDKPSNDTPSSGHFHLFIDTKVAHLNKESLLTWSGISTKGYKDITLSWNERVSQAYIPNGNTIRVDYSVDSGNNWDSIPHSFYHSSASPWKWTNGGVPIHLPAKANDVNKLMLRWVAGITSDHGNYSLDDLTISGTGITTGISKLISGNSITAYTADNSLFLDFPFKGEIFIFSANGGFFMHSTPSAGTSVISLDGLPSGVYIARIVSGNELHTLKFVKNNF